MQSQNTSNRNGITLSPFYHSAVNAIAEPNRLVFCSRYLIERWSPLLGGTGLQILLFLRSHCFHDRRTGECRNQWQVSRAEIAQSVGVSEATVKRELAQNEALRLFVQPQQEYCLAGGRGGVRRDANSYRIAMDDPIHQSDWPRVEAYVAQAEAQREKGVGPSTDAEEAKRRARLPKSFGDEEPEVVAGASHMPTAPGQIDPAPARRQRGVKLTQPPGQFDPTQRERDSKKTLNESTLNVRGRAHFVDKNVDRNEKHPGQIVGTSPLEDSLNREIGALVEELQDWGSERRHRQLLSICDRHGLSHLSSQALQATRARLAKETRRGIVGKPGAYYQSVLLKLLEGHQVFVPKADEDDADEVRRQVRQSLGLD